MEIQRSNLMQIIYIQLQLLAFAAQHLPSESYLNIYKREDGGRRGEKIQTMTYYFLSLTHKCLPTLISYAAGTILSIVLH